MKKRAFFIFSVIVLFFCSAMPTFAASSEEVGDGYVSDFSDVLPDGIDISELEEGTFGGVGSFISILASALDAGGESAISFFTMLLGLAALMAVAESGSVADTPALSRHTSMGIAVISSLLIFGRLGPIALAIKESIRGMSVFFSALVPIFTGILSAGGNVSSATTQAFNMNISLALVSQISTAVLLPIAFSLFALALASGIDSSLGGVAKSLRSLFNWILGIAGTVIIAATSMQSVIARAQDTAYLRAAKFAASGMIPVVGSTVSGALSTLAGGLSYAKSTVGIYSVAVLVMMSAAPLVSLLLHRVALNVSASFLEFVGVGGGVRVFSAFRAALDALISVYVIAVVVYILEIVVFLRCGVSVFG